MFGINEPDVPGIEAKELKEKLDKGESLLLLDVRTPEEFSKARIDGSVNLPIDELEKKADLFIEDKNKNIYVYCLSGSRSTVAVDWLLKNGYKNTINLNNGLLGWRVNKFETV